MPEKAVAIVPARLAATRLPNKPLLDIAGKTMIQRVYERAALAKSLSGVYIATPDEEILSAVAAFGGQAILTSHHHRTGTDRIAEAATTLTDDISVIVNVQGDEPLIDPETIDALAQVLLTSEENMASVMCPLPEGRDSDPNVVKVVCDAAGRALYFSRAGIPYHRNTNLAYHLMQHIGMYAYRRDFLMRYPTLPQTPLEQMELMEQLRVLENGYRIQMVATDRVPESVDTPEDLERVRNIFAVMDGK